MRHNRGVLKPADRPLAQTYDLAVLDLDGVLYVGRRAVSGAVEAVERARAAGQKVAFVTNNAARPPEAVAVHLGELGVPATREDVVTSAQAAARLVAGLVDAGSDVFLLGGDGLEQALAERGLRPVTTPGDAVAAVAQGYGPQMPWRQVIDGAILVADGRPWVASNTDMTFPTERGLGPGNGTLVDLVARFAGRRPIVAGKPERALFEEALERVGGGRPLFIGDRLDTDIAGAARVGWDSLLVMTGVTGVPELVAAPRGQRPSFLGADLGALLEPQPAVTPGDGPAAVTEVGGWSARVHDGAVRIAGAGDASDWWRALAGTAWTHLDRTGEPVGHRNLQPPR